MEIAGRYTLDREVGRGGMGAVWLGTDQVLGRQVALKRLGLAPGGTPDLERAEREARLAARLNHPHVVAVFDLVEEDDDHWLVMEYVDGVTLAELVRRDGALTPDQASPLLRQAAEALAAAHEAGIVHRDVKPSNILVSADGQVKLSDFGIARAEQDSSLTQTGLVTGSPAYLSPEVASGRTAQPAADVWSLGATAYHALSGKPPYDVGDNVMGALYRIVHEEPPRLDDAGWLTPMLEHTMDREPDHRWPMAQVRDFLAGGPVGASAGAATVTQERAATAVTTPVPAPVPAPEPVGYGGVGGTQVLAPTPAAPTPPTPVHRRGPSGAIIGVLLGLGVVLLFLLFAWMFGAFDAQDSSASDSGPGRGPSSLSTASTPSEPSSSATDSAEQEAAMRDFATSYVQAAVDDPGTSWDLLTPEYQAASGSFGQYKKFWDQWESADVTDVSADVGAGTVSYTVSYHGKKDDEGFVDDVTLELEPNGDGFLIAGAR
jgi:serine/threonine protein kinase